MLCCEFLITGHVCNLARTGSHQQSLLSLQPRETRINALLLLIQNRNNIAPKRAKSRLGGGKNLSLLMYEEQI